MQCHECQTEARGICADCGIALCGEHGQFDYGERALSTDNAIERATVDARWLRCQFDREARATG